MAAVVFTLPPAAPVASSSARPSPRAETEPSSRFDHVLGDAQSRQQAAAKADDSAAAGTSSPASPAAKSGKADGEKDGQSDEDASDRKTPPASDDPRAVLGWLQGQVAVPPAAPATPATPAGVPGAASDVTQSGAAALALTAVAAKLSRAGDTPPTQAPDDSAPVSLTGAAASDGALAAAFNSLELGAGSSKEPVALTPALSAALAAVVSSTAPAAAPDVVARGVEQFQALLARSETASTVAIPPAPVTATTPIPTAPLAADSPDLPVRLGERLQWLVDSGVQEARIQLHPRELGTVNVQVRIEARGASVWFAAEHPGARAALESALPQLRERFAGDGMTLAQTQVTTQTGSWTFGSSQQQQPQSQSSSAARFFGSGSGGGDEPVGAAELAAPKAIVHIGLLDRYA